MFDFFKSTVLAASVPGPLIGYKICNPERSRKIGVAANSLEMLRAKAAQKLQIPDPRIYVAKDGVEVIDEEYFRTIAAQTLLVVAPRNVHVSTDVELIYASIRSRFASIGAGQVVRQFVNDHREGFEQLLETMNGETDDEEHRLALSSARTEHENWFMGQPAHLDTKEKVMRRRSQDRIRGYFYKTKDELLASDAYKRNPRARQMIDTTLAVFAHLLAEADYFGQLFNRAWPKRRPVDDDDEIDSTRMDAVDKKRRKLAVNEICTKSDVIREQLVALCDQKGVFRCEGVWNADRCAYRRNVTVGNRHRINPYASRENAIVFQIWNLDHGVEMTRSTIPHMLQAIGGLAERHVSADWPKCAEHARRGKVLSLLRYFRELFTVDNLRLVHIVCHDKARHDGRKSMGGVLCDRCSEFETVKRLCDAVR